MWGLQKYQNHYEILFGRGCIDLENSAILLLLAQGKSAPFGFFEDCNMTKYLTNIFLLWINVNRLCSHVGLEFWTPNSFMCPKLTIFTTWKFRFTTLYRTQHFGRLKQTLYKKLQDLNYPQYVHANFNCWISHGNGWPIDRILLHFQFCILMLNRLSSSVTSLHSLNWRYTLLRFNEVNLWVFTIAFHRLNIQLRSWTL